MINDYHGRKLGPNHVFILPILDEALFEQVISFFKLTMKNNCHKAMNRPQDYNPCTWIHGVI
jgi:hypothetical protein